MITDNELNVSNISPIRQDFYQLYPEIVDLVEKTSSLSPSTSNESDPMVVILKLLAFLGDKNQYNEDKEILETMMPSCTREDSMRKLCDLRGYEMKYYRSATTPITFMFQGSKFLPKYSEKIVGETKLVGIELYPNQERIAFS